MLHDFVSSQIDIAFDPLVFSIIKGLREVYSQNKSFNKIDPVIFKLSEYYQRLKIRKLELEEKKNKFIEYSEKGMPFNDLYINQIEIIDKIESFHQQVYSTISALILLINHIGISGKKEHPIKSVIKFLDFINKQEIFNYLSLDIDNIKKSVNFRDKFIDHPQQHLLYKWTTCLYDDKFFLVYTIERNILPEFVVTNGETNFEKLTNSTNYYISPDDDIILNSIKNFLIGLTIGREGKIYSSEDMFNLGITPETKTKSRLLLEEILVK